MVVKNILQILYEKLLNVRKKLKWNKKFECCKWINKARR